MKTEPCPAGLRRQDAATGTALSRRDFLARSALAGLALPFGLGQRGFDRRAYAKRILADRIPAYRYRVVSAGRLPEIKRELDGLLDGGRLSRAGRFRDQLSKIDCVLPAETSGAGSVIIAAVFSRPMTAEFVWKGEPRAVTIPPFYYIDDLNRDTLKSALRADLVKAAGARLEDVSDRVPLKLLAARSGLARVGRNNLAYVEGMGSFCLLSAYATDAALEETDWGEPALLPECRHCHLCDRICPTRCMTRENFIIDAGRCITLYNEVEGKLPNYILPSMHNALMGCLKCQTPCPANAGIEDLGGRLEPVSEEETAKILAGKPDDALLRSLQAKLKGHQAVASKEVFPVLTRNLGWLLRA
jgi:epoxyqueuosine reductase